MANDKIYKTTTLANLGAKLPIGFRGSSDYSTRDWTAQEELLVGEAIGDGGNVGHYCEAVLSVLSGTFGGMQVWDGDKRLVSAQDFSIALQSAWMPDVLTAYAYLRFASNKAPLKLQLRDPDDRGKPFEFLADMGSLEVRLPVDGCITWTHELLQPAMMGGRKITRLIMGPQKWDAIKHIHGNEVMSRIMIVASSVRGIPEFDERVEDASIDMIGAMRLSKADISALAEGVEAHGLGPIFMAEAKSPKTRRPFEVAIPWRYNDFFD